MEGVFLEGAKFDLLGFKVSKNAAVVVGRSLLKLDCL
jgi:hypothetical protein